MTQKNKNIDHQTNEKSEFSLRTATAGRERLREAVAPPNFLIALDVLDLLERRRKAALRSQALRDLAAAVQRNPE